MVVIGTYIQSFAPMEMGFDGESGMRWGTSHTVVLLSALSRPAKNRRGPIREEDAVKG